MSAGMGSGRMARRPSAGRQTPQPGSALWPDGGLQALSSPWWEGVATPCLPPRDRSSAAEPFPGTDHSFTNLIHKTNLWERFLGGKGGATLMARIFAVLTTLAALFLVVGASTKY